MTTELPAGRVAGYCSYDEEDAWLEKQKQFSIHRSLVRCLLSHQSNGQRRQSRQVSATRCCYSTRSELRKAHAHARRMHRSVVASRCGRQIRQRQQSWQHQLQSRLLRFEGSSSPAQRGRCYCCCCRQPECRLHDGSGSSNDNHSVDVSRFRYHRRLFSAAPPQPQLQQARHHRPGIVIGSYAFASSRCYRKEQRSGFSSSGGGRGEYYKTRNKKKKKKEHEDPFKTLGVISQGGTDDDAVILYKDVKAAFLRIAMTHHPDTTQASTPEEEAEHRDVFIAARTAFEMIAQGSHGEALLRDDDDAWQEDEFDEWFRNETGHDMPFMDAATMKEVAEMTESVGGGLGTLCEMYTVMLHSAACLFCVGRWSTECTEFAPVNHSAHLNSYIIFEYCIVDIIIQRSGRRDVALGSSRDGIRQEGRRRFGSAATGSRRSSRSTNQRRAAPKEEEESKMNEKVLFVWSNYLFYF